MGYINGCQSRTRQRIQSDGHIKKGPPKAPSYGAYITYTDNIFRLKALHSIVMGNV